MHTLVEVGKQEYISHDLRVERDDPAQIENEEKSREPPGRIELPTFRLRSECSTTEL